MTTSTTPPLLTPLPPAPLPTDAEAVFDAKAGASLTAQAVMVGEVNTALNWQADSMAATAGSMTAAAGSAAAAAASATAAAGSVVSAQTQVGLAAVQAGNAAASANSAQVAAAAAGSAVGLPSVVGHGGQALVARKDESGFELKSLSQSVGDILETTRTPDETYLLPNTIYSKAAYPELFPLLGSIEINNDASNFSQITISGVGGYSSAVACGKDDVMIVVGTSSSQGPNTSTAFKSLDSGLTWVAIAALTNISSFTSIGTDGSGVWIVVSYVGSIYRSSDNGLTWSAAIYPAGLGQSSNSSISTSKTGVWIVTGTSDNPTCSRSLDNGLSWASIPAANLVASAIYTDGLGTWYTVGSGQTLYRSSDNCTTWFIIYSSSNAGIGGIISGGNVTLFYTGFNLNISIDKGRTWKIQPVVASGVNVFVDKFGVIYILQQGCMYKSFDGGESWVVTVQVAGSVVFYPTRTVIDSNGVWFALANNNSTTGYRATRLFYYDSATQFKTPFLKSLKGYQTYIKGKLQ